MPYIGKNPTIGNFVKLDSITTSATATFNLTNGGVAYSPQSANHCIVSLNGVIQSPNTSFTISGSTIVFASALTSNDVIDFILVLGDVLNIGTPSDNTVSLAKLTATGTKDATTFLRGDNTFQTIGTNTPAFFAYQTSTQSVANSTFAKVQFQTELFDTDNCFDNVTNFRFTPNVAGKYMIASQTFIDGSTDTRNFTVIYKNGVYYSEAVYYFWSTPLATQIIEFNGTTDYVEIFLRQESGTSRTTDANDLKIYFYGYKLIE